MPIIKPISDLRNHFNEISEICHRDAEPVFITRNGLGDMVVMSMALYEHQQALIELYQKIGEAEAESLSGAPVRTHREVMKKMRKELDGHL
jgi:prevent-host-death family protein